MNSKLTRLKDFDLMRNHGPDIMLGLETQVHRDTLRPSPVLLPAKSSLHRVSRLPCSSSLHVPWLLIYPNDSDLCVFNLCLPVAPRMDGAKGYSDVIILRVSHLTCHFLREGPRNVVTIWILHISYRVPASSYPHFSPLHVSGMFGIELLAATCFRSSSGKF